MAESDVPVVHVDVVSDVVCPWCYIGKRRLEMAVALTPEIAVEVNWRPYFLNQWIPREGIDRQTYLETKFGSPGRYAVIAERVAATARSRGSPSPSTRSAASRTPSTVTASSCGRAAPRIPAR
jgi:predicted DsbA family dithiol-disulfide isomerase